MSHVDPYGGTTEPRGWQRPEQPRGPEWSRGPGHQDGPAGRQWPAGDDDAWARARQGVAAPDAYSAPTDAYPVSSEPRPAAPEAYPSPADGYRAAPDGYPGAAQTYPAAPDGFPDVAERYPAVPQGHPGAADGSDAGRRRGGATGHRNGQLAEGVPDPTAEWRSPGPAGGPARPEGGVAGYRDRADHLRGGALAGAEPTMDAPTNPVGWPLVDPDPQPNPDPASSTRPGRGRRRATRSGKPAGQSRAGRNLPAAIGVGLVLGAAIVVPLFLFRPAFLVVVALAVSVGIWEMTRAVRPAGMRPPLVPLVAGGLLMVGLAWWAGPDALSLGLLVTVLATMVWRLGDGPAGYQRDMTAATLIAVYVPFLGGFAALLAAEPADGDLRVLVTLAAVVLSDTGGYAAGVAFGKHPMAPSVSPKKSWEGFAGSVLAAAVGSSLLLAYLLDVELWWGALFGVAVSVAAVLGDLAESMIKRDLKVKDMSNLLPGHGGLMDRLDSILFAVPTAYLLLAIFVPAG
ncbi:phosphatidate cytidylyltransferase [Plantactinospora sp. KLBMP9567]|uniref:phosphatidate cytidylyltransferase n=1 Tax=Plantactinospora sp. KLBMP9567 TaxID=3085900 RepID=UPI002981BF6B|nr:phosphatidate cytidylyltransferase [Plantactinospora sp. KLBMP9567]MDW5324005.1 phosphatidate cytidylyltransferase [Plantactinospora sp. KLBMP9567]